MSEALEPERRQLLLDRLAAGQWNGIPGCHPSRATRKLAREAFKELCDRDEAFAKKVEQPRESRRSGARYIVSTENGYCGFRRRRFASEHFDLYRDLCEPGQAVILSKVRRRGGMKVLREYVAPSESEVSVRTEPPKGSS